MRQTERELESAAQQQLAAAPFCEPAVEVARERAEAAPQETAAAPELRARAPTEAAAQERAAAQGGVPVQR